MKQLLVLLVLCLAVASILAGCNGVVDTYDDRVRRYKQINNFQTRMIVDDWDYIWLYERSSNLSEWNPRIGH